MSPRRTRRASTIEGKPELHVADPVDPITPPPTEDGDDLPFFTQLKRYSEAEWDRLLVYLYRLEPRVKNSDGPAYIEKFGRAIDEDDIKNAHGGGKYQVWLKDTATDETVRKVNITIAGAPILQSNQILQSPAGAAAAATTATTPTTGPPQPDALTAVVGMLERTLSNLKHEQPTTEQANKILIDTMQRAHTMSLELVTKSQGAAANSSNTVMDKLLTVALERMTKEKNPLDEMKNTLELMKLMRPDPPAAAPSGDALGSLKLVKDALGLDVKEMLELKAGGAGDGGNAWQTAAVNALPGIVEAVPKVFEQLNHGKRIELEIQRTQLQREQLQLRAMEIQRGLPPTPIAHQVPAANAPPPGADPRVEAAPLAVPPLDPPPATTATGAASVAPADPSATSAEAELNEMAALVVRCFRAGRTGDQTAEVAEFSFPAVVGQLEPFIDSVATVDAVVRSNAVLAQMVTDPRYAVFLDEFVDYFIAEDDEVDEKEPEGVRAGA